MSDYSVDDLEMPGYFLPEESQFRLARLANQLNFLARLARPRTPAEEQAATPEIRMGELAFCMELLAEQVNLVLREVSWPARRQSPYSSQDHGADTVAGVARGRK
ncbi:hypothetical protein JR065_03325 [Xanthomonas sp. AmX2]|uniref:XAC0095 family protein n=1 Tax=Xanthomonas sp. TaxID=29446 RepID=UPI0019826F81|nr:hypothetical protein [Xanthomonas sp.]MBN6149357.1 hypothetical protein [Xanthomonas sp.]